MEGRPATRVRWFAVIGLVVAAIALIAVGVGLGGDEADRRSPLGHDEGVRVEEGNAGPDEASHVSRQFVEVPEGPLATDSPWRLRCSLPDGLVADDLHVWWAGESLGHARFRAPGVIGLPAPGRWLVVVAGPGVVPTLYSSTLAEEGKEEELRLHPTGHLRFQLEGKPEVPLESFRGRLQVPRDLFLDTDGFPLDPRFSVRGEAALTKLRTLWREEDPLLRSGVLLQELAGLAETWPPATEPDKTVVGSFLGFSFDAEGTAALLDLPAGAGWRWRPFGDQPFLVEPRGEPVAVDGATGAIVRDLSVPIGERWSAPFVVPPHGSVTHRARLQAIGSVSGRLDFAASRGAVRGVDVVLYSVERAAGSSQEDGLLVRFSEHGLAVPDASAEGFSGSFSFEPVMMGEKALDAHWSDEHGNHYVVHRGFSLGDGEHLDLGLLTPDPLAPLRIRAVLWDEDGNTEVVLPSEHGQVVRLSFIRGRPQDGLDLVFAGDVHVSLGQSVEVLGLPPRLWRVSIEVPDGKLGLADWASSRTWWEEEVRLEPGGKDWTIRIPGRRAAPVRLRLHPPPGIEAPAAFRAEIRICGLPEGVPPINDITFRRNAEGWLEAELPATQGRGFLVLRGDWRDRLRRPGWNWVAGASLDHPMMAEPLVELHALEGVPVWIRFASAASSGPDDLPSWFGVDVVGWPIHRRAHFAAFRREPGRYQLGVVPPGVTLRERLSGREWVVPPEGGTWEP